VGNCIAIFSALFLIWFMADNYPTDGYTQAERNSMNALVERNTVYDWDAIGPLKVSDIPVEILE